MSFSVPSTCSATVTVPTRISKVLKSSNVTSLVGSAGSTSVAFNLSSSIFIILSSILANRGSGSLTILCPAGKLSSAVSQFCSWTESEKLSSFHNLSAAKGIYGSKNIASAFTTNAQTPSVVLAISGASFTAFHGALSLKYLLHLCIKSIMPVKPVRSSNDSILPSIFFCSSASCVRSNLSASSSALVSWTTPSKNLLVKVSVRWMKLPKSATSSLFTFVWYSRHLKSASSRRFE